MTAESQSLQDRPLQRKLRTLGVLGFFLAAPLARSAAQRAVPDAQSVLSDAGRALDAERPYAASQLLAPLLNKGTRDPYVLLLAARAAAGWEGWGNVEQLLAGQSWLDTLWGGEGRALLARARVERSEPAVEDAHQALTTALGESLGPRLVVLARAFDRADLLDSAAQTYLRAAAELPSISDWLRLRAAGVTSDSAARARLLESITIPAATPRIRWTEALARSRAGDYVGAATVYTTLRASFLALRMQWQADSATPSASLRRDLLAFVAGATGDDLRAAVGLLDRSFRPLSPIEELAVARRASTVNAERAAAGFARADTARLLTDSDRLAWGLALGRLGRNREAMRRFDTVRAEDLIAQARYQHARSLLALGQRGEAMQWLREIFVTTPGRKDTATFATAGYLTAELLADNGDEAPARVVFRQVAERFPRTSHGVRAAFQAALMAWIGGNKQDAARGFAALADRAVEHSETVAAMYWSGRALWDLGDTAQAAERWRGILRRYPSSYYGLKAGERLGVTTAAAAPTIGEALADTTWLPAFDRAALLDRVGLHVEARFEYDRLARSAEGSAGARLGMARMFLDRGNIGRAFRLVQPIADAASPPLTYPFEEIPSLVEEARRDGVDPFLAAALIRQESLYDLGARSRADARGWMQVMPALGASLARREGIREWDVGLLHQPEINIRFGMTHLAGVLNRYASLPVALAAYNAGARAAESWAALPGARGDPEVFIERIQYVETRDYVRRVLRNVAAYRTLYGTAETPTLRPLGGSAHLGPTRLQTRGAIQ